MLLDASDRSIQTSKAFQFCLPFSLLQTQLSAVPALCRESEMLREGGWETRGGKIESSQSIWIASMVQFSKTLMYMQSLKSK